MNVSDALEIERGIVFKQGYCKEKSLQKVVLSKNFWASVKSNTYADIADEQKIS